MTIFADIGRENMRQGLACCCSAVVTADAVAGDEGVIEQSRQPGHRSVAIIAIITAINVAWMLARGDGAIVTRTASADDLRVVNGIGRCPDNIVVAILAHVGRRNMCQALAGGGCSVMTVDAVARDAGVVKGGWQPGDGRVTVITSVTAVNVVWMLACSDGAVVT